MLYHLIELNGSARLSFARCHPAKAEAANLDEAASLRKIHGPHALMNHESSRQLNPLRTMPNLLTIARICMAPFLVSAVLEGKFVTGFVLFMAAGITDALDGMLARVLKQRTILGQYLDPVADKLLLSTLFLVLTHMNLIPIRVTALVFGRDLGILVVAAILYSAAGRRDFKPSVFGNDARFIRRPVKSLIFLFSRGAHSFAELGDPVRKLRRGVFVFAGKAFFLFTAHVVVAALYCKRRIDTAYKLSYLAGLPRSRHSATRSEMFASPTHMTVSAPPQ